MPGTRRQDPNDPAYGPEADDSSPVFPFHKGTMRSIETWKRYSDNWLDNHTRRGGWVAIRKNWQWFMERMDLQAEYQEVADWTHEARRRSLTLEPRAESLAGEGSEAATSEQNPAAAEWESAEAAGGGVRRPQERHSFGRGSWWMLERLRWEMDYRLVGGRVETFVEIGVRVHLSKADCDFAAASLKQALTLGAAAAGAMGGGAGGSVVPVAGTAAGAAAGAAAGGAMGELAGVVVDFMRWMAFGDDGLSLHLAPRAFQCGNLAPIDPNAIIFARDLWRPVRQKLERLNPPAAGRRVAESYEATAADGDAEVTGRLLEATPLAIGEASVEGFDDEESVVSERQTAPPAAESEENQPPAAPAAGSSRGSASAVERGQTVEGQLQGITPAYYRMSITPDEPATFTIYTRLEADSGPLGASFAIQDMEGGNLDVTQLRVTATGEDFDRDEVEFAAEEEGPIAFRLRLDEDSAARISYRITVQ